MKVLELVEGLRFLREQRNMLKGLVSDNERESARVLSLVREQGVDGPSEPHEWDRSHGDHEHSAPGCCSGSCWCQRDLQGPTKVGK